MPDDIVNYEIELTPEELSEIIKDNRIYKVVENGFYAYGNEIFEALKRDRPDFDLVKAFPYLKQLADLGYIKSFKWLADCYYYGFSCEINKKLAKKYYFEGMLFDESDYCKRRFADLQPGLKEYCGASPLINYVKSMVYEKKESSANARLRIAELILDEEIEEYRPESAYVIMKQEYMHKGITDNYRLAECVYKGIGTEKNPAAAEWLLDETIDYLEILLYFLEPTTTKEMIPVRGELVSLEDVYKKARELRKYRDEYEEYIRDEFLEDAMYQIRGYQIWIRKEPLFIKRRSI